MGCLGRTIGKEPPIAPPGSRYIIDSGELVGDKYVVKLVLANQTTGDPDLKQVGPSFDSEVKSGQYRDWLEGGPAFDYGTGAV